MFNILTLADDPVASGVCHTVWSYVVCGSCSCSYQHTLESE